MQKYHGKIYKKNMIGIFDLLQEKQKFAIQNAKKLDLLSKTEFERWHQNPSTSVYKLVEELNKYLQIRI